MSWIIWNTRQKASWYKWIMSSRYTCVDVNVTISGGEVNFTSVKFAYMSSWEHIHVMANLPLTQTKSRVDLIIWICLTHISELNLTFLWLFLLLMKWSQVLIIA